MSIEHTIRTIWRDYNNGDVMELLDWDSDHANNDLRLLDGPNYPFNIGRIENTIRAIENNIEESILSPSEYIRTIAKYILESK